MGKGLNPADEQRKQEKKLQMAKDKKHKAVVKEVQVLLNDPAKIEAEMLKVSKELEGNRANKTLKDKLLELQRMKDVAVTKKNRQELLRNPGHTGHTGHTDALPAATRKPQDSVFYHPQFNPTGAPPPGQTQRYKDSTPAPSMHSVHPAVFGQFGVPPPPPRGVPGYGFGIPLGGQAGIPPPPPPRGPPPGSSLGGPPPHQIMPPRPQGVPRQRPRAQHDVDDPLDPSASGYTERFRLPSQPQPAATKVGPSSVGIRLDVPSVPSVEASEVHKLSIENVVKDDPSVARDNDEYDDSLDEDESIQPTAGEDISVADVSMEFNIEDIMRRRMLVQEDVTAAAVAVPRPPDDEGHAPDVEEPAGVASLFSAYGSDSENEDVDQEEEAIAVLTQTSAEATSNSVEASKPLRVVEVAPELKAFVPAALRTKRAAPAHEAPRKTKELRVEEAVVSEVPALSAAALEDEYSSFMAEISGLEAEGPR